MSKRDKGSKGQHGLVVEASHQALSVAAGWLGLSAEEALDGADGNDTYTQPGTSTTGGRTLFLGLGAKYLPHHKGVGFAAVLDKNLKHRLESGKKRRARQDQEEEEAQQQQQGKGTAANAGKPVGMSGDGDSDEDGEESKVAAFQRRKPIAMIMQSAGATHSRPGTHQLQNGGVQGGGHGQPDGKGTSSHANLGSRAAREAQLLGAHGKTGVLLHRANGEGSQSDPDLQMGPQLSKGQRKKLRKKQKRLEVTKNDDQQEVGATKG